MATTATHEEDVKDSAEVASATDTDASSSSAIGLDKVEQFPEGSAAHSTSSSSIVYRLLDRLPWPTGWSIAIIAAILFLLPSAVLWSYWRGGILQTVPSTGMILVRPFFPAVVITYVLIVVRLLERTRVRVAQSLRSLVRLDDAAYAGVIRQSCRVRPVVECIGGGIGAIFFFAIVGPFRGNPDYYMFSLVYYVGSLLMFSAVGWSVAAVILVTRLTNSLLQQPIDVDIFDVTPLEPVGLQSLYLSLFFLGLVVFIFPSSPFPMASWQNIAIYTVLAVIIVLVFFVNMYSTHRVLTNTKHSQMAEAESHFAQTYREMRRLAAHNQDTDRTATELNAWAVAKQELKVTRTWPYNTEMLRTLVISVMGPLLVGLSRLAAVLLAGGGQ